MINPNAEFLQNNYEKTEKLLKDNNLPEVLSLLEQYSEQYMIAPASTHKEYYGAFPGGLAYHNLYVLRWIGRFAGTMGADRFDKASLLKVTLLHDFGKVGTKEKPYFVRTTDEWHNNKGIYYVTNPELEYMKIPQRSLYMAQEAGIELSQDEYLAISLSEGHLDFANSGYKYKEPDLAIALHYAIYWARKLESQQDVSWPTE